MKKLLLILSIFLLICASLGCTEENKEYQNGTTEKAQAEPPEASITILNSTLEFDEITGYTVTGIAQSNVNLDYAEIDVKYYDESGALVQSDMTNIEDLAANEPWKFKVYGPGSDVEVKEYKIAATTTA